MDRVEHLRDMVERLRGRARFLRNRKEIKSPKLMEHAADEIERLCEELAAAQAVIEQMHRLAFDRHDAMLDQVVESIMKDDSALQQRLAQERERVCEFLKHEGWFQDHGYVLDAIRNDGR